MTDVLYLSTSPEVTPEAKASVAITGRITHTLPIPGADRIHQSFVDCGASGVWSGVTAITTKADDAAIVFLQDALLPPDPRWDFMASRKYIVRMARFKGVPSECVIIPCDVFLAPGTDLMDLLGVVKYEKPLPAAMAGDAVGGFPSWIPKTDEGNFQRVLDLETLMAGDWYATEKADGTSCTTFMRDGELRVCSRSLELKEFNASGAGNIYWRMARHNLLHTMPEGLALQFEIVGPGVQGNPMGLARNEIRVFTLYNHRIGLRLPYAQLLSLCLNMDLQVSRLITTGHGPLGADALRKLAEITYPNGEPGEGIVIRDLESTFSFKVINLLYGH